MNRTRQKTLFSLIVITTLFGFLALADPNITLAQTSADKPAKNTAITPEARGGGCLKQHKAMNERLAKGNVDLIFLGDSITKGWRSRGKGEEVWQEYYADRNAVGMGISGDRTQHVLWRLDNSDFRNVSPKLVVLMIGVNNFPSRNTPEEIIAGITKVVEKLREKLPKTHILLMSVCRGHNVKDKDNSPQKVAVEINQQIRKLEKDENVTFVDLAQKMMQPDGTTPKDLLRDGVHPTQKGYYVWAELIEPYVEKYVGKKKSPKEEARILPIEKGFTRLFDGETLDGWHAEGGTALYAVENGCIIGIVDKKSKMNSFLSTDKNYGDFILRLDVKFGDPACNSGIQFRSHARKDGRVYGYQCELDPGDRNWTGGIYDEARRGWLYKPDGEKHAAARKAFKRNDWNSIEIRAEGNSITTRVNGVPCADLTDDKDSSGFIGLQIHTGKEGSVLWRNIRIKELK